MSQSKIWNVPFKHISHFSTARLSNNLRKQNGAIDKKWQPVIGLEIHAQIASRSKLFSASPTQFNDPVNTNVSAFDAAFPGVQPQINGTCIDLGVKTALALGSSVQPKSSFDRKHYFYPDLPFGYQITQHYEPFALGGFIQLGEYDGIPHPYQIRIKQIQLEQDTGKSIHDIYPGFSLIDLNRAGIGLMEIVTEPDIRTAQDAGLVVRKLQALLRCVGSSNGNMEEGSMRCDVNVSIREPGGEFGTRCELKNLSSVKFLMDAIEAEVRRQINLLEHGMPVRQETRGYDASARKTFLLRTKETAPDYRYMPEPDLPPLLLSSSYITRIKSTIPELPDQKRERMLREYGIPLRDVNAMLNEPQGVEYYEELCNPSEGKKRDPRKAANWMVHELFGQLHTRDLTFIKNPVSPGQLGSVLDLVEMGVISGKIGKNVVSVMVEGDSRMAQAIVEERGWKVIEGGEELEIVCEKIMAKYPDKVMAVKGGNHNLLKWFVGQVMQATRGKASPKKVIEVLESKLIGKKEK
ncbi:uncharacterized protein VTP21DRAFT_415 [Calcarisporiella thermophila]|uniref:uncharacterized protein n=1 Tax=Calcarisporiella thermophila TaxID=911321 RepID=UPI00374402F7